MTARERFLATIRFEPMDRPLMWECGFWKETIERWYGEGLRGTPRTAAEMSGSRFWERAYTADVEQKLGFDEFYAYIPVESRNIHPAYPVEIIEDHGDWVLRRNANGAIERAHKSQAGIRAMVRAPVQTREDWERVKSERLRPVLKERTPPDLDRIVAAARGGTQPIRGIQCEHWLTLGELVGVERLLCLMLDDPAWLKQMLSDLTEFYLSLTDQLLRRIVPDLCWLGGDFCYKSGPLMSPAAFREFLFPGFRKIADLYRSYGVPAILMHTDGDCRPLIPLFIEAGVTGAHPFEVTNGQDIVEVRKAFPRFHIFGGIDKKAVAAGREATDRELEHKVPFMMKRGGWVPYVDHAVPPSIGWADFVYYRRRLAELAQAG